jgi:hypothetical protein
MRWVFLLASLIGFFIVFTTNSPGILGMGLLVALGSAFGFVFSLAASRIAANAQPEITLIADPEVSALRKRKLQEQGRKVAASALSAPSESEEDDV